MCLSVPLLRLLARLPWILFKLGENVGTSVRLIVWKFHKNRFSFDVIMTSFLFFFSKGSNFSQREATLLKGKQLCSLEKAQSVQRDENYDALTVTLASAIFLFNKSA